MDANRKSQRLTLASVVARGAGQVSAEVDGETLPMSIERGKYYGMDSVGSYIWALLEQPRSVGAICDALTGSFEVERERLEVDVIAFLGTLLAKDLVTIPDEAR